ncbi:CBS domain-containing protein [Amycolatopsis sp. NPDC049253]|uniref:CBS domain-containing protein n=1 Tax=Amycolatopsis sp. NPDC049253 TaxID=3155274 RepID=UPI00341D8E2E
MRTRAIMTTPVISVTSGASLAEAAHLMTRWGFTTLPVVTRSAKLVGLISETDLVRAGFPGDAATGTLTRASCSAATAPCPRS